MVVDDTAGKDMTQNKQDMASDCILEIIYCNFEREMKFQISPGFIITLELDFIVSPVTGKCPTGPPKLVM